MEYETEDWKIRERSCCAYECREQFICKFSSQFYHKLSSNVLFKSIYKTIYDHFKSLHEILWFTNKCLVFTVCFGMTQTKAKKMAKMNLREVVLRCDEGDIHSKETFLNHYT